MGQTNCKTLHFPDAFISNQFCHKKLISVHLAGVMTSYILRKMKINVKLFEK